MAFKSQEFQGYAAYAPTIRDSSPLFFHQFGSWIWIFLCYTDRSFSTPNGQEKRHQFVRDESRRRHPDVFSGWPDRRRHPQRGIFWMRPMKTGQDGQATGWIQSVFVAIGWKKWNIYMCYFFMEYLRFTMKMSWKNWKDAQKNCKGMFASESSSKVSAPSRAVQKRVMKHVQEFVLGTPQGFLNDILRLGTTPLRF